MKKIVTFTMWYSNDIFYYMFKAEFVTLVSLKVPSGSNTYVGWFPISSFEISESLAQNFAKLKKYKTC